MNVTMTHTFIPQLTCYPYTIQRMWKTLYENKSMKKFCFMETWEIFKTLNTAHYLQQTK